MGETYDQCKKNTGLPDPAKIKFMRTFRWVLDPTENVHVEEWQRIAVLTARDRLTEQRAKALKDVEASTSQPKKARTSAASSSSQDKCPPLADKAPKKKKDEKDEKKDSLTRVSDNEPSVGVSGLISFFGSKAM